MSGKMQDGMNISFNKSLVMNELPSGDALKVRLGNWLLDNPVIPASGTFGYGYEFAELYDINCLGTFSFKGTTLEPRFGNPTPRIAECPAGIINSIGLQNPGVDAVINNELPRLKRCFSKQVIANVSGFSIHEYTEVAARFNECEQVGIIEVNISCPNVHNGGMSFGTTCDAAAEVTKAVKAVVQKPIFIKLSPNVGMRIDLHRRTPVIANKKGGFSGSAIFPVALKTVYDVYEAVKIPIMGIGGVSSADDVLEMMLAGAAAVQIGAANLIEPYICRDIIRELPSTMKKYGINKLEDIIGGAHNG